MKLFAYKQGSESAKALAEALEIKRIRKTGKGIRVDVLLNWGCSNLPNRIVYEDVINAPANIHMAANKLETFLALEGEVCIPSFTESRDVALGWIAEGVTVVCRETLTGHSGEGVVIAEIEEEVIDAPLYTKYIKRKDEYRAHVHGDEVFFAQRKARRLDVPDEGVNWKIRNHANGFIYANKEVVLPIQAQMEAINAVRLLGLDFGAVDLLHSTDGRYVVLEVNTAPGLSGTTLDKYVEQFKKYF